MMQVIENEHYYTDFEQLVNTIAILQSLGYSKEKLEEELQYMLTGIRNSMRNGYKIINTGE